MILDNKANIDYLARDQNLSQQVSVHEDPSRSEEFTNDNIHSSTYSSKPFTKKGKVSMSGMQHK